MTVRKFWMPGPTAPHPLGSLIARNFFGTAVARPGDPLGDVNLHYGILHGGAELYDRCIEQGVHFVHVDHGFWDRNRDLGKFQGSFRFSLNSQAQQFRTPGLRDRARLALLEKNGVVNLGFEILHPGFGNRKTILYQPPSPYMRAYYRLPENFDAEWIERLKNAYPDGEIKHLHKGGAELEKALDECAIYVSFNSAAGIRALERGIPALMTWGSSCWPNLGHDSARHFLEARDDLFACLAGRCFSAHEIADGTAFFHMAANGEIP
jgi:hypothetical protein